MDGEGSCVQTCVVGVPAQFGRIEKEIELSFEVYQKHGMKHPDSRPNIRFKTRSSQIYNFLFESSVLSFLIWEDTKTAYIRKVLCQNTWDTKFQ